MTKCKTQNNNLARQIATIYHNIFSTPVYYHSLIKCNQQNTDFKQRYNFLKLNALILLSFPILNYRLDGWTRWDLGQLPPWYKIPSEKTLHLEYMLQHLSMLEVENDGHFMTCGF